jgi:hypothetical protein
MQACNVRQDLRADKAEAEVERLRALEEVEAAAQVTAGRLRAALGDLLRDVDARLLLDSGFKGMGHNIAVESSGRLRVDAEYARRVLRGAETNTLQE